MTDGSCPFQNEVERYVREDVLPHMGWMASLKSLFLLKLGPFYNLEGIYVRSRLLDHLLEQMFSIGPLPTSLVRLWVREFYFSPGLAPVLAIAPSLKAFCEDRSRLSPLELHERFLEIEHLGSTEFTPLAHLAHLKSADGDFSDDRHQEEVSNYIIKLNTFV